MWFLRELFALLFPLTHSATLVDTATEESFGRLVSPRHLTEHVVGLLPYKEKVVRAVVREAKFYANQKAVTLLAGVLRDYIEGMEEDRQALSPTPIVFVPVPLGEVRERERGFNQVERICKAANCEVSGFLVTRERETLPQTSLTRRERIENVSDAFTVVGQIDPRAHYVVVDDVTTTGATMAEVMGALTRAGAKEVSGIALAY